ncbi:serine/threonine-protein kinase haspin-like [Amblyomma americanum]
MKADRFTKIAHGKHSETFRVHSYEGDSAFKVVKIDSVIKSWDAVFRKMLIASKLSGFRSASEKYTAGFVAIKSVTCVFGSYPEELGGHRSDPTSNHQTAKRFDEANPERAYLAVHMTYAGVPLYRVELDSVLQLWSILQQMALSLAVAEEALEFEHRDLHLGHVLVKRTTEEMFWFRVGGRSFVIKTCGLEANVSGYSWARITDGGKSVFTAPTNLYGTSRDHNLLFVYKKMAAIVRDNWHAFYPLTNLLFLRHVTKELHRRYKHKFQRQTDRYEASVWSKIGSWRDCLLDYESLGDFVQDNIKDLP